MNVLVKLKPSRETDKLMPHGMQINMHYKAGLQINTEILQAKETEVSVQQSK